MFPRYKYKHIFCPVETIALSFHEFYILCYDSIFHQADSSNTLEGHSACHCSCQHSLVYSLLAKDLPGCWG